MTTPRQHARNAAGFALVWVAATVAHRVRFRVSGSVPATGPVIVVANHLTMTDPLAVARVVIGHRRFPHFLAMQEVFAWPGIGALARATGVDLPAVTWDVEHGPWFDNGVMTVVVDGHRAHLEVDHYRVRRGRVLRRSRTAPLTPPSA